MAPFKVLMKVGSIEAGGVPPHPRPERPGLAPRSPPDTGARASGVGQTLTAGEPQGLARQIQEPCAVPDGAGTTWTSHTAPVFAASGTAGSGDAPP